MILKNLKMNWVLKINNMARILKGNNKAEKLSNLMHSERMDKVFKSMMDVWVAEDVKLFEALELMKALRTNLDNQILEILNSPPKV